MTTNTNRPSTPGDAMTRASNEFWVANPLGDDLDAEEHAARAVIRWFCEEVSGDAYSKYGSVEQSFEANRRKYTEAQQ